MAGRKRREDEHVAEKPAGELVQQFSGCGNYPSEHAGVDALAKALHRAACDTGMRMQAIVDECLQASSWCPTPYDIRQMAVSMRDKIRTARAISKHAEWRRIYGEPQPAYSTAALGVLLAREKQPAALEAMRDQAIRDMLYYTEGEGRLLGDREYWEGPRGDGTPSARERLLRDYRLRVSEIRAIGGWQTERELQGAGDPA